MMIKGNERRVIVIENADSPYFDKAVFVLKRGIRQQVSSKTLCAAAEEMLTALDESSVPYTALCKSTVLAHKKTVAAEKTVTKRDNAALLCLLLIGSAVFIGGIALIILL